MNLGVPEILLILAVALLFFGPSRLPGLGKSIGEAIRGLKKGMSETEDIETQARKEEPKDKLSNTSHNQKSYHSEKETEREVEKDSDKKKV
jgi:sec-independent protein translocase protein TatA